MSFSTRIKEELVTIEGSLAERQAELSAMLRAGGYLEINAQGLSFCFENDKAMVTKRVFYLLKSDWALSSQVRVNKNTGFRGVSRYKLTIPPQKNLAEVLKKLGLLGDDYLPLSAIPQALVANDGEQRAYLRGLFLSRGSINNPAKSYYLEIIFEKESFAQEILSLMEEMALKMMLRKRRQFWVIYCNQVDYLTNFLNLIGAHKALLDLEGMRAFKEIKSNINRKLNWETANLDKTVQAALEQLEDIHIIANSIGLTELTPSLEDIAILRLKNPYLTLKELGEKAQPPLTKSGVNHRLRKLHKIASELREKNPKS